MDRFVNQISICLLKREKKEREIVPLEFAMHYGEIQHGGLNGKSVSLLIHWFSLFFIEIWLKLQLVIEKYLDN